MRTLLRSRLPFLLTLTAVVCFVSTVRVQNGSGVAPQVDAKAMKNAGTPADTFPGTWQSYGVIGLRMLRRSTVSLLPRTSST